MLPRDPIVGISNPAEQFLILFEELIAKFTASATVDLCATAESHWRLPRIWASLPTGSFADEARRALETAAEAHRRGTELDQSSLAEHILAGALWPEPEKLKIIHALQNHVRILKQLGRAKTGTRGEQQAFPAKYWLQRSKGRLSPESLRDAYRKGRVRVEKRGSNRNFYLEEDVLREWPHLFTNDLPK